MPSTDILLDAQGINAIAPSGSLNLSTAPDQSPSIRLTPTRSALELGGGGQGNNGQATLSTGGGEPRIALTTDGPGPVNNEENMIALGVRDNAGQINLARRQYEPQRREITVQLDAETGRIDLGSNHQPGILYVRGGSGGPQSSIVLNGSESNITVGGSAGISPGKDAPRQEGSITLVDTGNTASVQIRGGTLEGENDLGGSVSLLDQERQTVNLRADGGSKGGRLEMSNFEKSTTVDLDGGKGTLKLGWGSPFGQVMAPHVGLGANVPGVDTDPPRPVSGKLWLEDGEGQAFGLKAANSAIEMGAENSSEAKIAMRMEPKNGLFQIVDGSGNPILEIDTSQKTIRFAQDYQQTTA